MADEWDDDPSPVMTQAASGDPGRTFSRGRGFTPAYDAENNNVSSFGSNDNDFGSKSDGFRGRGGGRGGGRGRGGGFSGGDGPRRRQDDDEDGGGFRGRRDDGGGFRGRRNDDGGGFRGRRNDDDDSGGGFRGRRNDDGGGGGGFRGRRNDDDDSGGGFRGRRNDDDGGGGGFRGRRNDDDGGGGGFRGRRNDDDSGGGFKGRRNDDDESGGGGFRGRRNDDGGGGGGGGFRGRRNDDDESGGGGGGFRGRRNEDGGGGGFRGRRDDDDEGGGFRGRRNEDGGGGSRPRRNTDEDGDGEDRPRGRRNEDGEDKERPRELYIPPAPTDDEETMFAAGISSGINFDKYDNIRVKVTGENVPPAIDRFENAGLRQYIIDNVKKSGYLKPTPIQKHAIPIIMAQRDLMGCAQTGSGKTAAFLLPILNVLLGDQKEAAMGAEHAEPYAVIISPTRELTLQIFNEARKFAHGSIIKTVVAYGGTAAYHQAQNVMKGCHILVATPGRLLDFVNRGRITFSSVKFVVLDEADRMLDMGFLPDIEKMMNHPSMVSTGERQTLMFSATFPEEIQRLAGKFLKDYLFVAVGIVGGACTDVEQSFHMVSRFDKRPKLLELLNNRGGSEKTLVFVEMKRTADFIAAYLSEQNFPTTSIHGDRLQREREEALADFKCGRMNVLVATAVAARGLDIKNVAHVVNYDLPKSIDEYVHRIGRTGRVGNRGKATSFYDSEIDAVIARDLQKILSQAEQPIPDWLEKDAEGGFGGGGYKPRGGAGFGGRDVRKFDNQNGGGGGGGQPEQLVEEEEW